MLSCNFLPNPSSRTKTNQGRSAENQTSFFSKKASTFHQIGRIIQSRNPQCGVTTTIQLTRPIGNRKNPNSSARLAEETEAPIQSNPTRSHEIHSKSNDQTSLTRTISTDPLIHYCHASDRVDDERVASPTA